MKDFEFGFIRLHSVGSEDSWDIGDRVRIGTLDIEYIEQQVMVKKESYCHIRTDDGFCQRSFCVSESPMEVLALIAGHDNYFKFFVRDFAERNKLVLLKGETW